MKFEELKWGKVRSLFERQSYRFLLIFPKWIQFRKIIMKIDAQALSLFRNEWSIWMNFIRNENSLDLNASIWKSVSGKLKPMCQQNSIIFRAHLTVVMWESLLKLFKLNGAKFSHSFRVALNVACVSLCVDLSNMWIWKEQLDGEPKKKNTHQIRSWTRVNEIYSKKGVQDAVWDI